MTRSQSESGPPELVLASSSPRRRLLLPLVAPVRDTISVDVDESPRPGESAQTLASRLALEKAELASPQSMPLESGAVAIVAADTVVSVDGRPLGKPGDESEARDMLRSLRGRAHDVITGVAVRWTTAPSARSAIVQTRVVMRDYTDREIDAYIARGEPFDKAGGYAMQDPQFRPVKAIEGCLPNVVGLPLCAVASLLERSSSESEVAITNPPCPLCRAASEHLRQHGLWSPPAFAATV